MSTYQPKFKAWGHQQAGSDKMRGKRAFALLMAMRTGKTKVCLDDFGELELGGEVSDMLLLAPASVYETWQEAMDEHLSLDLSGRLYKHLWTSGGKGKMARRREEAFLEHRRGPRALLVNLEALSTVDRARTLVQTYLSQRPGKRFVAVDESTAIKNVESSRGEFVNKVVAPLGDWKRILCGLPTPRSPLDLYGQFNFLDPNILGFHNFKAYEARYANIERVCMIPQRELEARLRLCSPDGKFLFAGSMVDPSDLPRETIITMLLERKRYVQTIPVNRGFRYEEELQEKIAPFSYRCLLSDAYDVPEKTYSFRNIDMTPEQKRIYEELKEFSTAELDNQQYVTAQHVIVKMLRLHQVLCGHVTDDGDSGERVVREIKENRTKAVLEILEEYDGKAIIWCAYDYNVRGVAAAIEKEYGHGSVARFWGGNRKTREDEERMFKTNPKCRFIVATGAAGGKGRMWAVANLHIYHSSTNNLEHRLQSEERGDVVGKKEPIAMVDIRVKGTVEDRIVQSLRDKLDMSAKITGDNWREWLI